MELNIRNVDHLCASVDLSQNKPIIDLSDVTFFKPFALIYIGMFLRFHNAHGKSFTLLLPKDRAAHDYMTRQNFWERFNFSEDVIKSHNLHRFTTTTSLNDIVDIENRNLIAEEITEAIRNVLMVNGVPKVNMISEIVGELVDNFASHSTRRLAALHMQCYPLLDLVILAIGDCGIGIRESLSSNPKYAELKAQPHSAALLKAFEPLVSRRSEGGTGLYNVRESIINNNGFLTMSSGDEYVRMSNDKTEFGKMAYDLPGVQINLSFPLGGKKC